MSPLRRRIILPAADADLKRQMVYLDSKSDLKTALRFYTAARSSIDDLAKMPGMGTIVTNRVFKELRRWRVKGFEKILIFYYFDDSSLYVVRILHGMRDVETILDETW